MARRTAATASGTAAAAGRVAGAVAVAPPAAAASTISAMLSPIRQIPRQRRPSRTTARGNIDQQDGRGRIRGCCCCRKGGRSGSNRTLLCSHIVNFRRAGVDLASPLVKEVGRAAAGHHCVPKDCRDRIRGCHAAGRDASSSSTSVSLCGTPTVLGRPLWIQYCGSRQEQLPTAAAGGGTNATLAAAALRPEGEKSKPGADFVIVVIVVVVGLV